MFHRDIWNVCRGYDERLIYWGWMEGDLALRLNQKHQLVEFSKHVGHDFYHLEHYSNMVEYKDRNGNATPRKKNHVITDNLNYKTNHPNWGLFNHNLHAQPFVPKDDSKISGVSLFLGLKLLGGCGLLAFDFPLQHLLRTLKIYFGLQFAFLPAKFAKRFSVDFISTDSKNFQG